MVGRFCEQIAFGDFFISFSIAVICKFFDVLLLIEVDSLAVNCMNYAKVLNKNSTIINKNSPKMNKNSPKINKTQHKVNY